MNINTDFFKLRYNLVKPQKGSLLISEPFAPDSFFQRSVVLLTEHNEQGSIGFILNKFTELRISQMLEGFDNLEAPVGVGGPVSAETIHYIHSLGAMIPGAIEVIDGLYWGGDFDVLRSKASQSLLSSELVQFFLGYSGWAPGQLDSELEQNFWLVGQADAQEIMRQKADIWSYMIGKLGGKYQHWKNFPHDPSYN